MKVGSVIRAVACLFRNLNKYDFPSSADPQMMVPRLSGASWSQSKSYIRRLQRISGTQSLPSFSMKRDYSTGRRGPLISAAQLKEEISPNSTPIILDCTWFMPNVSRNAFAEFKNSRIPGARFFDLDKVSDTSSPYPHMLPSSEQFAEVVGTRRLH